MGVARARSGVPIRLSDERWAHITRRHSEMRWARARVLDTIASPDLIQQGDYGALIAGRYYHEEPLAHGFIVSVYRELSDTDGFVITAYFARGLSGGRRVLWVR